MITLTELLNPSVLALVILFPSLSLIKEFIICCFHFLSDFATPDDFYKDDTESGALIEDELNKDYDKYESEMTKSRTKEFSESDLFNLIDSMYSKRDGE